MQKNKKKILLLTPTSSNEVAVTKWYCPNLAIERLAGHINKNGHCAVTFDTNINSIVNGDGSVEEKLKEQDWDYIGFSILDDTMAADIGNMILASKICPDAVIIAGGTGAQFNYQTIFEKTKCRIVILGEGEKPLLRILDGEAFNGIPGIVVRNYNEPLLTEDFIEVTNSIDYENIDYEKYWDFYIELYKRGNQEITKEVSRQIHTIRLYTRNYCPMNCSFCSATNFLKKACGKAIKQAYMPAKDLVVLLKRIIKAHPRVETIYFTEDDFCTDKKRLHEFLNLVIEEKLPLTFISFARIDDFDEDVIPLLKKAGFRTFNIGVETFHPDVLKEFNKGRYQDLIEKHIKLLNENGIIPTLSFILCSPKSTLAHVRYTLERAIKLEKEGSAGSACMLAVSPLKGSTMTEQYVDFETQKIPIPDSRKIIKRDHFIICEDPEVRELQYRFLYRWANFVEEHSRKTSGHYASLMQEEVKLDTILETINEIESERGRTDQFRYSYMAYSQKDELWNKLRKYSYGTSDI